MRMIVEGIFFIILLVCMIPGLIMFIIGRWLVCAILQIWAMSFRDDFSDDEIKKFKYVVRHPIRPLLDSIRKGIENCNN